MGKHAELLIDLLRDPTQNWMFDDCVAVLGSVRVWTANLPIFDTNTYPVPMNLSLADKWRVWRALRVARENFWIRRLTTEPSPNDR